MANQFIWEYELLVTIYILPYIYLQILSLDSFNFWIISTKMVYTFLFMSFNWFIYFLESSSDISGLKFI